MATTKEITKALGGERLGSGNKMNIELHKYNRSSHDLSRAFRTSMTVGTLVPFFKEIALNGDTWSIDLAHIVKTIPAIGPLFGSYKLQMDVFCAPIRLYNGLLHNNMIDIGMDMAKVKLPKITLKHKVYNPGKYSYEINNSQIAYDSLCRYMGISGIGDVHFLAGTKTVDIERKFNAVPLLAYYDIYKNYYANKQEGKGYIITPNPANEESTIVKLYPDNLVEQQAINALTWDFVTAGESTLPSWSSATGDTYQQIFANQYLQQLKVNQYGFNLQPLNYVLEYNGTFDAESIEFLVSNGQTPPTYFTVGINTIFPNWRTTDHNINLGAMDSNYEGYTIFGIAFNKVVGQYSRINIKSFNLSEIDDARIAILQNTGLGNELDISTLTGEPYVNLCLQDSDMQNYNKYQMNGLALKTYQADVLTNWLKTEWIDGTNGIGQITAIDTSSGSFTLDALNLAQKVYNMLNRIAVSGGTFEDWQEAVYSTKVIRRAETPFYIGGASAEIVFQEVVQQSQTTEDKPLGTMAGKGTIADGSIRGGQIEIKITEPSYIIGLVSITPRVDYSQGNDWDMCELDTLNDVHKPALDGIGFQDLLQERAAWFGTVWDTIDQKWRKHAGGKTPAWIDYMTSINKCYGDFADDKKCMFMTLNRRFEYKDRTTTFDKGIKDWTSYINPTKYNYSFADNALDAQNFWVQIGIKAIARRVMSAKQIPNL